MKASPTTARRRPQAGHSRWLLLSLGLLLVLGCSKSGGARFERKLEKFGTLLAATTETKSDTSAAAQLCRKASLLRQQAAELAAEALPGLSQKNEQLLRLQTRKLIQATREFEGRCQTGSQRDIEEALALVQDQYRSLRSVVAAFK